MYNKLLEIGEKVYSLLLINVLIILCSTPIITLLPALVAGSIVTIHWIEDQSTSIPALFLKTLRKIGFIGVLRGFVLTFWGFVLYHVITTYFIGLQWYFQSIVIFLFIEVVIVAFGSGFTLLSDSNTFMDAFVYGHKHLIELIAIILVLLLATVLLIWFNWLITLYFSITLYIIITLYRRGIIHAH